MGTNSAELNKIPCSNGNQLGMWDLGTETNSIPAVMINILNFLSYLTYLRVQFKI